MSRSTSHELLAQLKPVAHGSEGHLLVASPDDPFLLSGTNEPPRYGAATGAGGSMSSEAQAAELRAHPKPPVAAVTLLVLLPWALFAVVMPCMALSYDALAKLAWVLVAFIFAVCISLLWWLPKRGRLPAARAGSIGTWPTPYWTRLVAICSLATAMASLLGLFACRQWTVAYHLYTESPWYSNVSPSSHPDSRQDAGTVTFSADALVDTSRSIGYRAGGLYCVAPVLGGDSEKFVGFWAVGYNCCRERAEFRCGDVRVPDARSGLSLTLLNSPDLKQYTAAIQEAAAINEYTIPQNPILLHWVDSPVKALSAMWQEGLLFYAFCLVVWLLACLGLAVIALASARWHPGDWRTKGRDEAGEARRTRV